MKTLLIVILTFGALHSACAQTELLDRYTTQVKNIDSLNRIIDLERRNRKEMENQYQATMRVLKDSVKIVKRDLHDLRKFKEEKDNLNTQLIQKSDSISLMKLTLSKTNEQLATEKRNTQRLAGEEREKSKENLSKFIIEFYQSSPFDNLIDLSSLDFIRRDARLMTRASDLQPLSGNLDKFFAATKALQNKFDAERVNEALNELSKMPGESKKANKMRDLLGNYKTFSDGLRETITKLIALDKIESVANMPESVKKAKYNKVFSEISRYIFNYDLKFSDYPYLTGVISEIIKLKQPNPDADISGYSSKL